MKKYLFMIGVLLLLPISVRAESATIDLTSSKTNVSPNTNITVTATISSKNAIGTYEYTLDYNHSLLELTKGNSYVVERANSGGIKKFTKSFEFKVKSTGTSNISVKSYAVTSYGKNANMDVIINPVTINSKAENSVKSKNNYLSSLEVEGYKLNPTFNKNTTNYILKIEDNIDEINVKAKKEDENANVTGTGKHSLSPGENKIEVIVTSESGAEKKYSILVTLKEQNAIKVKIEDKEYTVIKNLEAMSMPKDYKLLTIEIDDQEVQSYYSDTTELNLVGLKDDDGKVELYIYDMDNNTYTPYTELKISNVIFVPLKSEKKFRGLSNVSKYTEKINDLSVDCYKLNSDSDYCILYGANITAGDRGWYTYDLKENTIQRYNIEFEDSYKDKIKNTKILIYILSATTLLFGITTIAFAVKSNKRK